MIMLPGWISSFRKAGVKVRGGVVVRNGPDANEAPFSDEEGFSMPEISGLESNLIGTPKLGDIPVEDIYPPGEKGTIIPVNKKGILSFLSTLWAFTRPHTFIGTALCIPALHIFAAPAGRCAIIICLPRPLNL